MNFMQKCKRNGGFTLVELIVVIAILAILAGVAVPAYTGYIKKAEEAADQQLLGAVNTAFAAACLEQGEDVSNIRSTNKITLDDDGTMPDTIITTVIKNDNKALNAESVNEAFGRYFAGNDSAAFKVITELYFSNGVFVQNEEMAYTYGGNTIYVDAATIQSLKDSTFINAPSLGVDGTLNKVAFVSSFAGNLFGTDEEGNPSSAFGIISSSESFQRSLATYMGVENAATMDAADLAAAIGAKAEAEGWSPETQSSMAGNAMVLYAAQNASSSVDKASITAMLTSTNPHTAIIQTLTTNNDPGKAMAQAALAYGMYTAYAHQSGDAELIAKADSADPTSVLTELKDKDFQEWVASAQGQKDMEGYLSALNVIGTSAQDGSLANDVLMTGFNNEDLKGLLGSIMDN